MPDQPITGLSSAEVAERVARGETNAFKPHVERTYWQIFRDNVLNLFNIVLLALLTVVFLFRDYNDIFFAGFSVAVNTLLGTLQEINAKRALERLAALSAQDVQVIRDGKITAVPIQQVVKDDVLPLEPGVRLVVDGCLLRSDSLEVDESLLTGESDAVAKNTNDPVCSGSFVIAGVGTMVATQVGEYSTANKLSSTAKAYRNIQTPTQRRVAALVEISVVTMIVFGIMVFVMGRSLPVLEMFRNAVVLVTSVVPQGLVLVTTLSLTLGAVNISRHKALVQRLNAVESMGTTDVLCFDKTGTLTKNELSVTDIMPLNGLPIEEIRAELNTYIGNLSYQNKPAGAIAAYLGNEPSSAASPIKQREIPFTSAHKWGAIVLADKTLLLGAPERVLRPDLDGLILQHAEQLAANGQRVLAFALSSMPPQAGTLDTAREPLALVVMSDQIRGDIQATLDAFSRQHVALKVISGDNIETVRAVAATAGMTIHGAVTGEQLEGMSREAFDFAARDSTLFARIEPDTKRKIIASLRRQGRYVAMVGDGVNDVPALKEADLAIAMNDGAQITKDVADIVLLNNAMSTLPLAFAEGKEITQKIYGTAKMFLVKNCYTLLLLVFTGFMALPFPVSPIQISWVVFGTINLPTTLIAFGVLKPTYLRSFTKDVIKFVIVSGLVGAMGMSFLYALDYLATDRSAGSGRSAVTIFMALYGVLIFWHTHGLNLVHWRKLRQHLRILLIGIALAVGTIILPFMWSDMFRFTTPRPVTWLLIAVLLVASAAAIEILTRNPSVTRSIHQLLDEEKRTT